MILNTLDNTLFFILVVLVPIVFSESYCQKGFGFNSTTETCSPCQPGEYSYGGKSSCLPCNSYGYCQSLDEIEKDTKCPFFSFQSQSVKCDYCPIGKFVDENHDDCYDCSDHCLECLSGSKGGECLKCESGYGIVLGKPYCEQCDESKGMYSDGTTKCLNENEPNVFVFKKESQRYFPSTTFDSTQIPQHFEMMKNCEIGKGDLTEGFLCEQCYEPYVLIDGICQKCSGFTHFENGECVENMFGCIYQVNEKCFDCERGFVLNGNQCVFIKECDIINDATCSLCTGEKSLSTNGICNVELDHCVYSENDECLLCENTFNVSLSENQCDEFYNCQSSIDEYCRKTNETYLVNKITGKVQHCDNHATVCLTPNTANDTENDGINQLDFACEENFYLIENGLSCKESNTELSKCSKVINSDCVECKEGYFLLNGECVKSILSNCLLQTNGYCNEEKQNCEELAKDNYPFCLECQENTILYHGQCLLPEDFTTELNCQSFENNNCLCKENEALDMTGCVEIPSGCVTYGYEMKQCLECEEYGLYGDCYHCSLEANNLCFLEGEIDGEHNTQQHNSITKRETENLDDIDHKLCYTFSNIGCMRCIEGYYLQNGTCHQCDVENCIVCDSNKCHACSNGYTLDLINNQCTTDEELKDKCQTMMPDGGCAICKDGYYRAGTNCERCDESCSLCFNENECIQCNTTYFKDELSMKETKLCLPYSELLNCTIPSEDGCKQCEIGFYLDETRCKQCSSNCTLCSSATQCSKCSTDYIFSDTNRNKCIHFKEIEFCIKPNNENDTCSECSEGYQLKKDYSGCDPIPPNYGLLVGIPVATSLFAVILIIIIIIILIFFMQKRRHQKKLEEQICIFEMKNSNMNMNSIGNEIVSNLKEIDFNAEKSEIPVNEESRAIICLGNESKSRMKIQITTLENREKYSIRAEPQIISLKHGFACEFEIFVTPRCSCSIEDDIIITTLNLNNGTETQIPLKMHFNTILSTRLDPDELIEEKKLGEGSFGIVFLGTFRGNKVAIKKMKQSAQEEKAMEEFEKEVNMLDKFRCDYIVHFYGAVFIPNKICMVTEFAQYGSLQDLLDKRVDEPIEKVMQIKILLDCAKGIKYLHDNGILHRDIKPDNFLVVSLERSIKVNAKLTDFGASRNLNMMMTNMTFTKGIGTPKYMAPEILKKERYKKSADVYSFGITMLQIMIWKEPFPKTLYKHPWDIADSISHGKRPVLISEIVDDDIKNIIENSWKQEPDERTPIDEIELQLEIVFKNEMKNLGIVNVVEMEEVDAKVGNEMNKGDVEVEKKNDDNDIEESKSKEASSSE